MTPKEKAEQLFEEEENMTLRESKWVTVAIIKARITRSVEDIISKYKNSTFSNLEQNEKRTSYWQQVLTEIQSL